jgi:beta-glucosidase
MKIYFDEGIYVGYRYFDKNQIEPFFPFGFGLSYTKFNLSNLQINHKDRDHFSASLDVQNMGNHRGAAVLQLYIGDDQCSVDRPLRELQAFTKVDLTPGQQTRVSIPFDSSAFRFFSPTQHQFIVEPGTFTVWIGESSRNLPLSATITYE